MTKEFLRGLEVNSCRSQVGCQRVTEAVPADHLVRDSRSNESRTDDLLEHHIGRDGLLALQPYRRKEEVSVAVVRRDSSPFVEVLNYGCVERNRLAACFGRASSIAQASAFSLRSLA